MVQENYVVILFYKFVRVDNPEKLRDEQKALLESCHLKGRMLIAGEGVNATFEGLSEDIETYKTKFREDARFADVVFKESVGNGKSFTKLQVKVRKEIVTLGAGEFDVKNETAPEITAEEMQRLYETNEDFVVLDLRNDYEVKVGQFDKTVNPELNNFRDLPEKLQGLEHLKDKKIVAVCTGDIRCEKATCLMKREGFTDVYQLKDGIHAYMQQYPGEHFKGSLFVFDNRMMTSVVDTPNREVIATCKYCGSKTEDIYNDDSVRPSLKVLCCEECIKERGAKLRKCL